MTSPGRYARSRSRILGTCRAAADARELRRLLVDEVRRTVGFDAYAWLLTDPETAVGTAPLADVPCLPELPKLIRLKYLTAVNRWTTLPADSVALLQEVTDGAPSRSRVWRELLAAYDVGDVASLVFRDGYGYWGFLDLWRIGREARFARADATVLRGIVEPITQALRRCQASTFGLRPADVRPWPGPVALLLSPELDVRGQTPSTETFLHTLVPPSPGADPIPASAYNVAAQLLAVEADIDHRPAWARVHLSEGRWVSLRAARIGDADDGRDRDIAVTIEQSSPAERVGVFARVVGLSARETELLRHLVRGSDTRDLARRMYVSEYTVQDHLKSMFAKSATNSRRALLSRVLGT